MTHSILSDPFSLFNQETVVGVDGVEHLNVMLLLTKTSFASVVNVNVDCVVLNPVLNNDCYLLITISTNTLYENVI